MQNNFVIASAFCANTDKYFIFRDNGMEVSFEIINGYIRSLENITDAEKEYINLHFNTKNKVVKSHILSLKQTKEAIEMHLKGFETKYIASHFNVKYHVIDRLISEYWCSIRKDKKKHESTSY